MKALIIFAICFAATVSGSISGMGGGIIIKPVLDAFGWFDASQLSFMSGCTVLAMSAVSCIRGVRQGTRVNKKTGLWLALGAAAGGIAGKLLFRLLALYAAGGFPIKTLQNAAILLLTIGVALYILNKKRIQPVNTESVPVCIIIGLILGLLSAFLGIGGGPFNIAVLSYFFSMDSKTAAFNSLAVILVSQATSLAYTVVTGSVPTVDAALLAVMVAAGVSGGFLGRSLGARMSVKQTDILLVALLIFICAVAVYNLF